VSDPLTRSFAPGDRLDRYELVELQTSGAISVWQARAHGEPRVAGPVALKAVVAPTANPAFTRRLLDEARVASAIAHPNVLQVLDVGQDGGTLFVVTEWLDGIGLADLHHAATVRGDRLPLGVALRIALDVGAALDAMHRACDDAGESLVAAHGRLSLASIVVTREGIAKLVDFGVDAPSTIRELHRRVAGAPASVDDERSPRPLSSVTAADRTHSPEPPAGAASPAAGESIDEHGSRASAAPFVPPEAAMGRAVDWRGDVWALGAMLRLLLAGEPARAELHDGATPAPFPPDLPRIIGAIVTRALAQRADERFATAGELGAAIERAIVDTGLDAGPAVVARYLTSLLPPTADAPDADAPLALASTVTPARPSDPAGRIGPSRGPRLHAPHALLLAVAAFAMSAGAALLVMTGSPSSDVSASSDRSASVTTGTPFSARATGEPPPVPQDLVSDAGGRDSTPR